MANRSDRGGDTPKGMLAYLTQGRLADWLPARLFHPGQELIAPANGPKIRLQSDLPHLISSRAQPEGTPM